MTRRPTWGQVDIDTASRSPFWTSLADNPPCLPWCTTDHDPNDFRVAGSLGCRVAFGRGVTVEQVQVADESEPFHVDLYPPEVVLEDDTALEMTAEDARAFADALRLAADFCETHQ